MKDPDFRMANEAICHAANMTAENLRICAADVADEMRRPSVIYRPALYPDGGMWCALYGENLQEGLAGFGDTPEAAMKAFDEAWRNSRLLKAGAK